MLKPTMNTCDKCKHWEERDGLRFLYPFVSRLEKQEERRARVGYCTVNGGLEGPQVDGDSCEKFEPQPTRTDGV